MVKLQAKLLQTGEETADDRGRRIQEQRDREEDAARADKFGAFDSFIAARGERYRACSLANYEVYDDAQTPVVEALKAYVDDLENNIADGRGVFMFGSSGTGKDHLLAALARVAILQHEVSVKWISGQQLFGEIRDAMDSENAVTEGGIIKRLTSPLVLVLSDPAPVFGSVSSHQGNILYRVIDERYNRRLATWVSINVADRKEAEKKLGGPVVDRMAHDTLALQCQWPSYRQRKP